MTYCWHMLLPFAALVALPLAGGVLQLLAPKIGLELKLCLQSKAETLPYPLLLVLKDCLVTGFGACLAADCCTSS